VKREGGVEIMSERERRTYPDRGYEGVELGQYTEAHPARGFGKPTFKGSRVKAHQALEDLRAGRSIEDVMHNSELPRAAIQEALTLAIEAVLELYSVPSWDEEERRATELELSIDDWEPLPEPRAAEAVA